MAGRIIVVTSGKGGVGKTTFTANVGYALADKGYRVLLIDGDVGLRNLDVLLGLERRVIYNIMDVITGRTELQKALVKDKRVPGNLFLLPTSQTRFKEDIPEEAFVNIVKDARDKMKFDFILIDSPAGIEYGFRLAARPAEEAIIVTIPEITAIRDADRVIGLLDNFGIEKRSLVVNRVDVAQVKDGNVLSPQDIAEELSIKLLGVVPMDSIVTEATNEGKPVVVIENERGKKSLAGKGFVSIADRIVDDNAPLWDPIKEYVPSSGGLLGFFKNLLGGSGR